MLTFYKKVFKPSINLSKLNMQNIQNTQLLNSTYRNNKKNFCRSELLKQRLLPKSYPYGALRSTAAEKQEHIIFYRSGAS